MSFFAWWHMHYDLQWLSRSMLIQAILKERLNLLIQQILRLVPVIFVSNALTFSACLGQNLVRLCTLFTTAPLLQLDIPSTRQ